jgi:hypothetical protein
MSREVSPVQVIGCRTRDQLDDALQRGPRKRVYVFSDAGEGVAKCHFTRVTTDPLVHSGRHFGRVVYTFCNVKTLLVNGLERLADDQIDVGALSSRYNFAHHLPNIAVLLTSTQRTSRAIHISGPAHYVPWPRREATRCFRGGGRNDGGFGKYSSGQIR